MVEVDQTLWETLKLHDLGNYERGRGSRLNRLFLPRLLPQLLPRLLPPLNNFFSEDIRSSF